MTFTTPLIILFLMKTYTGWKVVFLDAGTLGTGDVSFDLFTEKWDCAFHDFTEPAELPSRVAGRNVAVTNKVVFDANVMARAECADLKLIAVAATGYNNVDLGEARKRGISVCNVAGYSTQSVAQQTMSMIMELTNHAGAYTQDVRAGEWERSRSFTLLTRQCVELAGKTIGIVGYGQIGRAVEKAARGFAMNVIVHDAYCANIPDGVEFVSMKELLRRADVITLHCPLTPETKNIIDADAISLMKPTAIVVNAARGGIVDEAALIAALKEKRIAGAATDVLTREPPPHDHPMLVAARELDNLVITPHVAWSAVEARQRLLDEIVGNIVAFESGGERNRVG